MKRFLDPSDLVLVAISFQTEDAGPSNHRGGHSWPIPRFARHM